MSEVSNKNCDTPVQCVGAMCPPFVKETIFLNPCEVRLISIPKHVQKIIMQICSFHKYLSHPKLIFSTVKSLRNANAALMGESTNFGNPTTAFGIWKIWTFAPVCAPKPVQKFFKPVFWR